MESINNQSNGTRVLKYLLLRIVEVTHYHMVQSESSQLRPNPRPGSVTVPDHLIRCKLKLRFGELKKGKLNICSKFNLNIFPDKTIIAIVTRNAF